ncbi:MAG: T9SS type A sorting domain-containing protein [Flavisolibacter sp.]
MKKTVTALFVAILLTASLHLLAQGVAPIPVVSSPLPPFSGKLITSSPSSGKQKPVALERKIAGQTPQARSFTQGTDVLVNNNTGAAGTQGFTQSGASVAVLGNHVSTVFNDAGSISSAPLQVDGFAFSDNNGTTFTDGEKLPFTAVSDAGEPIQAIDPVIGRIYLLTLGLNTPNNLLLFRSDNGGHTWLPPVNATPPGSFEDRQSMAVDNFSGAGNGNVYVVSRRFSAPGNQGINFYRSIDHGNTFGPSLGTNIVFGQQGSFVTVGPDHAVYVFWYDNSAGASIMMRKSTDLGLTFNPTITVATGLIGGLNGDMGLVGIRQGTTIPGNFRSNEFPYAVVNPVNNQIYVAFNNRGPGFDKADIFLTSSINGGSSWAPPMRVNDDATITDQWVPSLAVTPDGSTLGVFYYSRQEDLGANNLIRYYGRIADVGTGLVNFGSSFPVSDVSFPPEFGRDGFFNSVYMFDFNQPSATNDGFYVAWGDNRSDLVLGPPRKDPNVYFDFIALAPVNPNVFYSKPSGDLHDLFTWGTNPDGSGVNPSDFGTGKTFNLANRGGLYMMTGNWTVDGTIIDPTGSQLVLNGFTLDEESLTGGGTITGSPTSNLLISGSTGGDPGPLFFTPGAQSLHILSLDRFGPAASATLATPLRIYGSLGVINGTLHTGDMLTLNSDATGTANVLPIILPAIIQGAVTVERYIPARRAWRILSSPIIATTINQAWQEGTTNVSVNPNPFPGYGTHITGGPVFGSAANGFDQNPGSASSIKVYNSSTDSWVSQPNTNASAVGLIAYMTFIRGDRGIALSNSSVPPTPTTLRSKGTMWIGDITYNVSMTGFTALANPFASPIDFATMPKSNVQNSVWLWDPKMGGANGVGAYVNVSFNGTGWDVTPASVSPESRFIQSGQGFLVHSSGGPGQIVARELDKTPSPATDVFRKAKNSSSWRISLQTREQDGSSAVLDEVFTSYSSSFSAKLDQMDAEKLPNIEENLAIAAQDKMLMVERRNMMAEGEVMKLQFWNSKEKEYVLEFTPDNMQNAIPAWLEDKFLGSFTELALDGVTRVSVKISHDAASQNPDRFRVIFSRTRPGTADLVVTSFIKVYPNPVQGRNLNVEFNEMEKGNYQLRIINSLGQVVLQKSLVHPGGSVMQKIQLEKNLAGGVYQLEIKGAHQQTNTKLIIN